MTQSHTETRHREVAEHIGTVQYVVLADKRQGMHPVAGFMSEEDTALVHSNKQLMRQKACREKYFQLRVMKIDCQEHRVRKTNMHKEN